MKLKQTRDRNRTLQNQFVSVILYYGIHLPPPKTNGFGADSPCVVERVDAGGLGVVRWNRERVHNSLPPSIVVEIPLMARLRLRIRWWIRAGIKQIFESGGEIDSSLSENLDPFGTPHTAFPPATS